MSSKFSNDLANGMNSILKDSNFQRIFSKTASVKTAQLLAPPGNGDDVQEFKENHDIVWFQNVLTSNTTDAKNILESVPVYLKTAKFKITLNNNGEEMLVPWARTSDGQVYFYDFGSSEWIRDKASEGPLKSAEKAFNMFITAKKKSDDEDEEKEEKSDKSDKKKDKKDDKEEKSDKKKDKESDKDDKDEKDDKKSKKSKKDDDGKDEDDKDDKKKDKKKSFPFFKKKKAGVDSEKCKCGKDECDCGDKMYANALKHIVESFTVTSDVLDNMGLEKSAVATMAILNHIIEEAATLKFARESVEQAEERELKEKLEKFKAKFKKMHEKDATDYDDEVAEALDEKITKLEDKLKDLKKKDLSDENDVRGTDLLLGLNDQEAHEGFMDPEFDDPKSSAVLEDILSKNPKLVDEIAPNLKSKFNDKDIEEQLKSRIQSRLPEVVHTPEDTNIDSILKAYQEARNDIPPAAKLPGDFEKGPKHDPFKTQIDELNADDIVRAYTLIEEWTKTAHEFEDDSDNGISVGDIESILDVLGDYSKDEIAEKEKSFKHPKNLTEFSNDFYDAATEHDKNSSDDEDFGLEKLEKEYPEAYEALPEPYKNDSALVFFIDKNGNLCAEGDFGTNKLEEFLWVSDTKEWVAIK